MHFCAVFNCDSGTFRTMDLDAFSAGLIETLGRSGHGAEVHVVQGKQLARALAEAASREDVDVVIAGGGDGTVSLAAGLLADSGKVLGILPAGTMNLYARTLRIPLEPDAAVAALASGRVRDVDIARANGKPFVHQFSVGLHPQLIELRSRIPYRSRLGKIWASIRAAITTLMNPLNFKAHLTVGDTQIVALSSAISVTNNLYAEGQLPYAETPTGGVLGIYITRGRKPLELVVHLLNMALGRWRDNPQVDMHRAPETRVRIISRRRLKCALDGELHALEPEVHIQVHPRSLRVLVPADEQESAT